MVNVDLEWSKVANFGLRMDHVPITTSRPIDVWLRSFYYDSGWLLIMRNVDPG